MEVLTYKWITLLSFWSIEMEVLPYYLPRTRQSESWIFWSRPMQNHHSSVNPRPRSITHYITIPKCMCFNVRTCPRRLLRLYAKTN